MKETLSGGQKDYINYAYLQGFEDAEILNKLVKMAGTADVDIRAKEISNEQKSGGEASLKLSITLKTDGYYCLQIPLNNIPMEGSCWLDFKFYVDSSSTLRVRPGISMGFPSLNIKGCIESAESAERNKWVDVKWDLVELGLSKAANYLNTRKTPGVTPVSCGKTLDGFVFMFIGKAGQSATIYIDDINIAGTIPSGESYKAALAERKTKTLQITKTLIGEWLNKVESFKKTFNGIPCQSASAVAYKQTVDEYVAACEQRIKEMRHVGTITLDDRNMLEKLFFYQNIFSENLCSFDRINSIGTVTVYVVNPVNPFGTRPDDAIIGGRVNGDISVSLCAREYEPSSLVVKANQPLKDVIVEPGEFKNESGQQLNVKDIDIRIVKSWHKRKMAVGRVLASNEQTGVLTPELLLYNDALIKVDTDKKNNYVLLNGKYELISERKISSSKILELSPEKFPVKDSVSLEPVNIAAGMNKQFWITFFVPEGSKPGIYSGTLNIRGNNQLLTKVKCSVTVNKFQLSSPDFLSAIYYRGILSGDLKGTVSSEHKSPEQYAREMENMVAHGVDSPTLYQDFSPGLLEQVLKIREKAGINNKEIYYVGLRTGA
ncbi:MAG: hypothetical protein ACYC4Q_02565, partial [Victivallaceae bacterium]